MNFSENELPAINFSLLSFEQTVTLIILTCAFSAMPKFESERRSTIPRDFRSGNPRRIACHHHGASLCNCDVITRRCYAGRHYHVNVNVISVSKNNLIRPTLYCTAVVKFRVM